MRFRNFLLCLLVCGLLSACLVGCSSERPTGAATSATTLTPFRPQQTILYDKAYIEEHLKVPYKVVLTGNRTENGVSNDFTIGITATANGYAFLVGDTTIAYLDDGTGYLECLYVADGDLWITFAKHPYEENASDEYLKLFDAYFETHVGVVTTAFKQSDSACFGRAATKFLASVQGEAGISSWCYYVDKETGICLQCEVITHDSKGDTSFTFHPTEVRIGAADIRLDEKLLALLEK